MKKTLKNLTVNTLPLSIVHATDSDTRAKFAPYGVAVKGLGSDTTGAYHKKVRFVSRMGWTVEQWGTLFSIVFSRPITADAIQAARIDGGKEYTYAEAGGKEFNRDGLNAVARSVSCRSVSPASKVRGRKGI
jgi:hypothetical protein